MDRIGTRQTRLVVIRGNSGSGKSTLAAELRQQLDLNAALVSQDYLRRIVLMEREAESRDNVALIDLVARFCLSRGRNVIVEGIFNAPRYGEMLQSLASDHLGQSRFFAYDLTLAETLRRHESRPQAAEFGEEEMQAWYHGWQPLRFVTEERLGASMSVDDAVKAVGRAFQAQ